ncbi:MAG TPA: FxLYD domain-containing protein [Methylomirabilota bacterium]|jgi:hypothetical protein|nr:FxLYD domain-containing protein [Methylomirabilota bacterium]
MNALIRLFLVLAMTSVAFGCGRWHDHDDDVVVESQSLVSVSGGCVVRGTVRNEGGHTLRVFLSWRAFNRRDREIGLADAEIRDLPRDSSRAFESTRFRDFDGDRPSCSEIDRIRRNESAFRD